MPLITLVCPVDRSELKRAGALLRCRDGHDYEIDPTSNVPMVFDPRRPRSMHARDFVDPLGATDDAYPQLGPDEIDAFVQNQIFGTGGHLYRGVQLTTYPRPHFPIEPPGIMLDVGAGWGRWSLAAAHAGWEVVAVDPWISACRAIARVAQQTIGPDAVTPICADGQCLPFDDNCFDAVFSYSVIQHLDKDDARLVVREMSRVLKPGGTIRFQMPNVRGLRQRFQQRRGLVADSGFDVRPWSIQELRDLSEAANTDLTLTVDGFFSLNAQWSERHLLPFRRQIVVAVSEMLRRAAMIIPPLVGRADSIWLTGTKH